MKSVSLAQLLLGMRPVDIPIGIALEKINFPFPSRYQLQRPLWLGVGLWVHSPLSMLGCCLVCICTGLMSATAVSRSPCHCQSSCILEGTASYESTTFVFSLIWVPEPRGERCDRDSLCRTQCSKVFLYLVQLQTTYELQFLQQEASLMRVEQ